MNKTDKTNRWFSPWRAAAPKVEEDDPADMGTAFGLDLSMDQGLPSKPDKSPTPAAKRALPERDWASRLGLRRNQAY